MNKQTTSKTQHTPGPWTQERAFTPDGTVAEAQGRGSTQIMSNGYHIGTWIDAEYDGHCPNSALIAAAPELLEALQTVLDGLAVGAVNRKGRNCHDLLDMAGVVRAAIAKAEGK